MSRLQSDKKLSYSHALGYYKDEDDKGLQGLKWELVDLNKRTKDLGCYLGRKASNSKNNKRLE